MNEAVRSKAMLPDPAVEALRKRVQELEEANASLRDELHQERQMSRRVVARTRRRLEETVEALREVNEQQHELLEAMEEGIVIIDAEGSMDQHSRAALRVLGTDRLAGRRISSLVSEPELAAELDEFVETALAAEYASNRMLASVNPLDGARLELGGQPRWLSANVVRFLSARTGEPKLLLVLRDRTEEVRLEAMLEAQAKAQRARIERAHELLMTPPALYEQVRRDARALIRALRATDLDRHGCQRRAHAIKGDARAIGLDELAKTIHEVEEALAVGEAKPIRTMASRLAGELAEDGSLLDRFAELRARANAHRDDPLLSLVRASVDREAESRGIEASAIVRSSIDRSLHAQLLDRLRSPILALVRNAVAHGGAPVEERLARGKPAALRIELVLEHRAEDLVIRVRDDGRGIDFEAVRRRAVGLGLLDRDRAEGLSRADLTELLFLPRLTTRDDADLGAGRGMGMDIVRATVQQLGGSVTLESEPQVYTECSFRFPLASLARLDGVGGGA